MVQGTAVISLSLLSALVITRSLSTAGPHLQHEKRIAIGSVTSDQGHRSRNCQRDRSQFFKKVESMSLMLRLRGGAEVGKGDPRWIVKELEDGKNVGAWHWEERDMLPFARKQLQGVTAISASSKGFENHFDVSMRISNITRLSGDAVVHLRKGKMWPLCDLQLFVTIEGECTKDGGQTVKLRGELGFEEITMDDRDDLQDRISVVGSGAEHDAWLRWLRREGKRPVVEFVQSFLDELSKQATTAQKEAVAATRADAVAQQAKEAAAKMAQVNRAPPPPPPKSDGGGGVGMVQLHEEFSAKCCDIFEALTVASRISAFTRCSDTVSDARPGGRFSLFSGQITGGYEDVISPEFIRCKWRLSDWPDGLFSTVRIVLHELGEHEGCRLELLQDNVPARAVESVERQWKERFFNAIKVAFGYGAVSGAHRQLFSGV